jgi:mannitol-1-/sugar-/sorbitol-6-phosphatase
VNVITCPGAPHRIENVTGLLLDLDGVLVHSTSAIEQAWQGWATERDLAWSEVLPHVHGRTATETIRILLPGLTPDEVIRHADHINDWQLRRTGDLEPVAGMAELVAALPDRSWAVITSCPRALAIARLQAGHYPAPSVLVSREDVVRGKPDPEGYLLGARKLGVPAHTCVVIEDSPAGVSAAKAASIPVVALTTTHGAEQLAEADLIVRDATELTMRPILRTGHYRGTHNG